MGRKDGDVVMFDSGISAADLVADIITEADVAYPITNRSYVGWLTALEQLIYSEIIKEQRCLTIDRADISSNEIDLAAADVPNGHAKPRFEDIYTVFVGDRQLIKTNLTSGATFPDVYYKINGNLGFNSPYARSYGMKIMYFVRPEVKTVSENDEIDSKNVMLPPEFLDIVRAKLRGEAYKIANEDVLAAKWLSDYNVLLETFKQWIKQRQAAFAM